VSGESDNNGVDQVEANANSDGAGSLAVSSIALTVNDASDENDDILAFSDASAGGAAFSSINVQCDNCDEFNDLSTSAMSSGEGSVASASIGADVQDDGLIGDLGAVATASADSGAVAAVNATALDDGEITAGSAVASATTGGSSDALASLTALDDGAIENASASANSSGEDSVAGAGVDLTATNGGDVNETSASATAGGNGSQASATVLVANASDTSVTVSGFVVSNPQVDDAQDPNCTDGNPETPCSQIDDPNCTDPEPISGTPCTAVAVAEDTEIEMDGRVESASASALAMSGGEATAAVTADTNGGTILASTAGANASDGGDAGAITVAEALFNGVADGHSLATATDNGVATAINECKATGSVVPGTPGDLNNPPTLGTIDGGDAQCNSIAAADGNSTGNGAAPSVAVSQASGLSVGGFSAPIAMSGAATGGTATSNSLASDFAPVDAEGNGWSVAGGCRVFVGCALAIAATDVQTGQANDVSFAFTMSQAQQGFGVGAAALSTAFGGNGMTTSSAGGSVTPGVGGDFNISQNSGDAQTIAVVGTNAVGGFDGTP
jgi:hypothetical protein